MKSRDVGNLNSFLALQSGHCPSCILSFDLVEQGPLWLLLWLTNILTYFKTYSHKTRLHIGQLVKDTSAKLKQASDIDHHAEVNVSLNLYLVFYCICMCRAVCLFGPRLSIL